MERQNTSTRYISIGTVIINIAALNGSLRLLDQFSRYTDDAPDRTHDLAQSDLAKLI
jgi:hypothetical protein